MKVLAFFLVMLFTWPVSVSASTIEAYPFDDPDKEEDYKELIDELRCLVCQNQNLAGSNAELAQDMRRKTYELVSTGMSKGEVATFMVDRYGDFVLYKPPLQFNTLFLWIGPFIIMVIGLMVLIRFVRKKPAESNQSLTTEQKSQAEQLLQQANEEK